uniref:40S ribosomal protein S3-3 n=1 Tax=Anthurium amnicola TaxID=1678845 RepID=A0A1D1YWR0_9ARAE
MWDSLYYYIRCHGSIYCCLFFWLLLLLTHDVKLKFFSSCGIYQGLWIIVSNSSFCSRACYGVLRFIMESGAKGCEVIVSGKLRAQRAKSMKFKDGYMISSGQPVKEYIDSAVRHVLLRQGVLGIKVKIMLDWDPKGKQGPMTPLPDLVTIHTPKDEDELIRTAPVLATDIEVPVPIA